jgi:hypothetical protein
VVLHEAWEQPLRCTASCEDRVRDDSTCGLPQAPDENEHCFVAERRGGDGGLDGGRCVGLVFLSRGRDRGGRGGRRLWRDQVNLDTMQDIKEYFDSAYI